MAYLSLEEQAYSLVPDHLWNQSQPWKEAFYADLVRTVHPHTRWTWEQEGWTVYKGITATTTYGLGPREYCVIDTGLPNFEDRLYRILEFLPARKVCLYPPRD